MIRHVVNFRFNAGTTDEMVDALSAALATLSDHIQGIRSFTHGKDLGFWPEGSNYSYTVIAEFDTEESYRAYAADPYHQEVIRKYLLPILKDRAAVQFEA